MRLNYSLSVLLVTLLSLLGESEAAPTRVPPQIMTFPIRSLHARNSEGVSPHVLLQQHINRGERRLARMTGRQPPSELELRARLEKRMYIVPADGKIDPTRVPGGKTQKRYNSWNRHLQDWRTKQASNAGKRSLEKRQGNDGGLQFIPGSVSADPITFGSVPFDDDNNEGGLQIAPSSADGEPIIAGSIPLSDDGDGEGEDDEDDEDDEGLEFGSGSTGVPLIVGSDNDDDGGLELSPDSGEGIPSITESDNGGEGGLPFAAASVDGEPVVIELEPDGEVELVPGAIDGAGAVTAPVVSSGTGSGNSTGVSPAVIQAAQQGGLTEANPPTTSNSLGLDIEGPDTGYVAEVQIGTPARKFRLVMDSGSADLWVGSEDCQSENGGNCGNNHQFLGPKSSSSFVQSKQKFQVTYGTGEVQGVLVKDDLNIGGLQLKQHTFGVANVESQDFSDNSVAFDGLMGVAQSTLSQQKTPTPVEALATAGLIPAPIVSFKISRLADGKNDGEVTFGGLDTTKFNNSTLVTLPNVNKKGFWEANLDGVTVDGQDLGFKGRTAILDTGTTLIVASPADATAIHERIQGAKSDGQGGFTIPCTMTQSIAFTFGGKSFAIDPRDIAFLPVDATNPTGDCTSGISAGQVGGANEWLVGDVFLKNAYFSTDVSKNTVSLAQLV